VIDGARQVVENYKPVIPIDPSWPLVKLGDVSEFQGGLWKSTKEPLREVLILRNTNFGKNGGLILTDVAKHFVDPKQLEKRTLQKGDILLENSGGGPRQPVGRVVFFDLDEQHYYSYSNFTTRIRVTEPDILPKFLFLILHNFYQSGGTEKIQSQTSGIRNLNKTAYKNIKIPLPNIEGQQEIILRIESEQRLIETNTSLVNLFEAKIAERIRRVWEGS
jgi:type I restriction enzyme S subunit